MYISKKSTILMLLILAIFFTSLGVYAEPTIQEIKALISYETGMLLNGKEFNPTDIDGSTIRPIVYKNKTYLPVRALCDALKVAVDYDIKTKTVILGEKKDYTEVDIALYENKESTVYTKDSDLLYTPEKTYEWGIVSIVSMKGYYYSFKIDTDKKYTQFSTTLYLSQQSQYEQTIEIRNGDKDGELLKLVTLKPGESSEMKINIAGIESIYCKANTRDITDRIIFGEPKLK